LISLLEATTYFLFPTRNIFLRSISVVNVTQAEDAAYFEHALSILSSSYVEFGGLNGTLGGDNRMRTSVLDIQKDTWQNGLEALANQEIYLENMEAIRERLELEQMYEKCLADGIDVEALKDAIEAEKAAEESCSNAVNLLVGKCESKQILCLSFGPFTDKRLRR
jgi:hypothetical protein